MSMLSAYHKYINLIAPHLGTNNLDKRRNEFHYVGEKYKFPLFPYEKYDDNFILALDFYVRDCIKNYKTGPIFEICDLL